MMVSLMVSMSSSACSVQNRLLNSSWNSIFFGPIRVASTLGRLFVIMFSLSTSTSSLMFTSNVDSVDDCYVSDDV